MFDMIYKIIVGDWEFIVYGESQEEVIIKLKSYLNDLKKEDGYILYVIEVEEKILKLDYEIEDFIGFVVG